MADFLHLSILYFLISGYAFFTTMLYQMAGPFFVLGVVYLVSYFINRNK